MLNHDQISLIAGSKELHVAAQKRKDAAKNVRRRTGKKPGRPNNVDKTVTINISDSNDSNDSDSGPDTTCTFFDLICEIKVYCIAPS
jgi:hypothetical protein